MFLFDIFKPKIRTPAADMVQWEDYFVDGERDCESILSGHSGEQDKNSWVLVFTKDERFFIAYKRNLPLDSTHWRLPPPEELSTADPPQNVRSVLMYQKGHPYAYRIGNPSFESCDAWAALPFNQVSSSYRTNDLPLHA